jgi:hypothetical protein
LPKNLTYDKKSNRKTVGGRFTEHLSKRNYQLEIEHNMGMGKKKLKQGKKMT